ncbi:hypothetical protein [[Phormidium] sp. ETS-05]|uniref:hypothetical protein n=1 Tax=[Phormidium] sp. ETS-05 TaxID=222819 RepID=UPI0018EF027E|nr:hypothetical protein [[Phormidium] sp. ETS-05]
MAKTVRTKFLTARSAGVLARYIGCGSGRGRPHSQNVLSSLAAAINLGLDAEIIAETRFLHLVSGNPETGFLQ